MAKNVQMPKMKFKRTIRSICLSMLICCLLIGGGLDMAVICHAEDGRAAIEPAAGNDCAKSPTGHSDEACPPSTENEFSSTDDCGDCLDVPLSIGPAVVVKEPCEINIAPPTSTATILTADGTTDLSLHHLPPQLISPPPCLAPDESVVLLI